MRRRSFAEATPAFDVWSFGATLFQLCVRSGETLWSVDRADNLSAVSGHPPGVDDQLAALCAWDEAQRRRRLRLVLGRSGAMAQPEARLAHDLLSGLLHEDPQMRPQSMRAVLAHPFFTAAAPAEAAAAAAALRRHEEEEVAVTRLEAR